MDNPVPPVLVTKDSVALEQIKIIELIHIIGNLVSGGMLWIIWVVIYMFLNKELKSESKAICYDIINFNLSFIIYFIAGFISLLLLVGFFILPVLYIAWLVFMVVGAVKHSAWERYAYPMVIHFIT